MNLVSGHLSNVVKTTVIPDEEGKPCPPRWNRLLPHSSTSHHPSRLRVFACPIIFASREGAKTRSPSRRNACKTYKIPVASIEGPTGFSPSWE